MQIVIHTFHRLFHNIAPRIPLVEICQIHELQQFSELFKSVYEDLKV